MLTLNRQEINISRDVLLNALRKNMAIHQAEYDEAYKAYCQAVIKALAAALERAKGGDMTKVDVNITAPTSHIDDYQSAITMLEHSKDESIPIDGPAFKAYVENNWPWRNQFLMVSASYN